MERLSASDSWYLYLESPTVHMQVSGVVVLDPAARRPAPLDLAAVRAHVAQRLDSAPEFRRRLVEVPFGLDHPVWVEGGDVDLDVHLRHHVVRRPTATTLDDLVGAFCSEPLDRTRPLWEMLFVEGLPGGAAALVTKLHHALVDGVTGVGVIAHLLDTSPSPVEHAARRRARPADAAPGAAAVLRDAAVDRLVDPLRPLRAARRTGGAALGLVRTALDGGPAGTAPVPAPRSPFNGRLTARRSVATGRASLAEVRAASRAADVAVNDVVLAACTVGLRRALLRAGAPVEGPLVASVPASMRRRGRGRRDDGRPPGRRQPANLLVPLPVHLDDPVEVLRAVHRGVLGSGRLQDAVGAANVGDVAELVPPPALRLGSELWSRLGLPDRLPPVHNLVVSSVPGSPVPLYLAGAPVTAMFPFGPLSEGVGLNVTVVADRGHLDVGMVACPDLVDDVAGLLADTLDGLGVLVESLTSDEVVDLTRPADPPARRPPARRPPRR